MCFRKEALTDDSEHGGHALVHGLYFDHGRVVDDDFLEGQRVNLCLCRHVNNFAGMKSDVVLVPDHRDLVMWQLHAEFSCFTLLYCHVLDCFDKL